MTRCRRVLSLLASALLTIAATSLFTDFVTSDGIGSLDIIRILLLTMSTFGLAWGAMLALNGLLTRSPRRAAASPHPTARRRTAILVPICNEDPVGTFCRLAAMSNRLAAIGASLDDFHFVVLSDTKDGQRAALEEKWFLRLVSETQGGGRMFYRRREVNTGRKAGNIADFVRRSGGLYDFLLILDADSLMEATTIVEMVRRIDGDPSLALLQTLPKIIHARSWFGRAIQFSASFFSPIFARGMAAVQGNEGVFWGHNAIVRTEAFASCCGLPRLSGSPPFGGHILSHDYVEAALLARGGWRLRLDTDLDGSFEEVPENIVDYAKRDRRWCQGNLQHARLLLAPGLKLWSRFFFLQGINAYAASPLWLAFLLTGILAPIVAPPPVYFPEAGSLFPQFPHLEVEKAITLLFCVLGLLVLPKFLILLRQSVTGFSRGFGGTALAAWSVFVELLVSSVIAPLMLMYQSRSVFQVLLGADGGWPASNRDDGSISLADAWMASWWIVAAGILALVAAANFAPEVVIWMVPIVVPMICGPIVIAATSSPRSGRVAAMLGLFATPAELSPSPVILERRAILARWRQSSDYGLPQEYGPAPLAADLAVSRPRP